MSEKIAKTTGLASLIKTKIKYKTNNTQVDVFKMFYLT